MDLATVSRSTALLMVSVNDLVSSLSKISSSSGRDNPFMNRSRKCSCRCSACETLASCKKIQFGVGERFTSNWKLNRQKGCFSELANSLEVTVNSSLRIKLFWLTVSKNFEKWSNKITSLTKTITLSNSNQSN